MKRVLALIVALLFLPVVPAFAEDHELCRFANDTLTEISGIATSTTHKDIVWAHNDSGGGPYVYAVDIANCEIKAKLTLGSTDARDFEAIAVGKDRIWLADIGDNLDSWSNVELLSFKEPTQLRDETITPRKYRFTYDDRPHNAEAIMVDPNTNQVWIITKQLAHGSLYALPNPLSTTHLNIATKLKRQGGLVTDASIAPDASTYVVRDYVNAKLYQGLPPGKKSDEIVLPVQFQGEAITWTADSSALIVASERERAILQVELPEPDPTPSPTSTSTKQPKPTSSPSPSPGPRPNDSSAFVPVLIASIGTLVLLGGLWLLLKRRRM
mgnify:CR=1 FL=1